MGIYEIYKIEASKTMMISQKLIKFQAPFQVLNVQCLWTGAIFCNHNKPN